MVAARMLWLCAALVTLLAVGCGTNPSKNNPPDAAAADAVSDADAQGGDADAQGADAGDTVAADGDVQGTDGADTQVADADAQIADADVQIADADAQAEDADAQAADGDAQGQDADAQAEDGDAQAQDGDAQADAQDAQADGDVTSADGDAVSVDGDVAAIDATPDGVSALTITIAAFAYTPVNLVVPAGATVTVVNADSVPHTVTSQSAPGAFVPGAVAGVSFDSGIIAGGATGQFTVPASAVSGTVVPYYCTLHLGTMANAGQITVQ